MITLRAFAGRAIDDLLNEANTSRWLVVIVDTGVQSDGNSNI